MVDFYDDAILDADKYVGDLFHFLIETGKLNNTIVILYSDHGMAWNPRNRVPLIIWFPNNQYTGKVNENVQLIDIAPTLLDYLGVSQPTWMHGQSILENNFPSVRNIISAETSGEIVIHDEDGWRVDVTKNSPPFYQLGTVNLVVCNKWFSLNLRNPMLTFGEIPGSNSFCSEQDIPSPEHAKDLILKSLLDASYDVSSFPKDIPMKWFDIVD
jgi:predicted AlkP superfamily pyrophosphatase or phosphodiesterase